MVAHAYPSAICADDSVCFCAHDVTPRRHRSPIACSLAQRADVRARGFVHV